ncbi:hypothetical protein QC764_511195 [Podospora pseudoanserina]|uniref:Uncharacterized protein n=1 Tax=Podospora pseudoanserina TaxID=2609844 RepID=A0ABR0I7E9_9PEZI|nr:hypothetical protein QC764_511195 [Podospora pseudoanserina]
MAPPPKWTDDYTEMGGDTIWGPDGEAVAYITAAGLDKTNLKPLFTLLPSVTEDLTLFQTGSPLKFYLWSADDYSLHKVTLDSLDEILKWLEAEDRPFYTLPSERIL